MPYSPVLSILNPNSYPDYLTALVRDSYSAAIRTMSALWRGPSPSGATWTVTLEPQSTPYQAAVTYGISAWNPAHTFLVPTGSMLTSLDPWAFLANPQGALHEGLTGTGVAGLLNDRAEAIPTAPGLTLYDRAVRATPEGSLSLDTPEARRVTGGAPIPLGGGALAPYQAPNTQPYRSTAAAVLSPSPSTSTLSPVDIALWAAGNPAVAFTPETFIDPAFILAQRPDVAQAFPAADLPAIRQWELSFGAGEGTAPNSSWSPADYLIARPDVAAAGVNPLIHYLAFGQFEGQMT